MAGPGSTRVILTALAANVGIAIAKFIAAGITGSSAMNYFPFYKNSLA